MKKEWSLKRAMFVIIIGIVVIYVAIIGTDYILSRLNKEPLFAIYERSLTDGGSSIYQGFGYKITTWKPLGGKHWTELKFFWQK